MPKKPTKKNAPIPAHPVRKPVTPNLGTLAFLHSLGVVLYIVFVAYLMRNGDTLFGNMDTIWGPIAFLMLFTISAAIVGLLIFARPIHLYLENKKKEAFSFTFATVSFLIIEALFVFIIMTLMSV
jgi:hypothetical protein